jgi:hypothetical protein
VSRSRDVDVSHFMPPFCAKWFCTLFEGHKGNHFPFPEEPKSPAEAASRIKLAIQEGLSQSSQRSSTPAGGIDAVEGREEEVRPQGGQGEGAEEGAREEGREEEVGSPGVAPETGRPPIQHELKSLPLPFNDVLSGKKRYEIRKADRGEFRVGDELLLREFYPGLGYSGREILASIVHRTPPGCWGLPPGLCVLGIELIATTANRDDPVFARYRRAQATEVALKHMRDPVLQNLKDIEAAWYRNPNPAPEKILGLEAGLRSGGRMFVIGNPAAPGSRLEQVQRELAGQRVQWFDSIDFSTKGALMMKFEDLGLQETTTPPPPEEGGEPFKAWVSRLTSECRLCGNVVEGHSKVAKDEADLHPNPMAFRYQEDQRVISESFIPEVVKHLVNDHRAVASMARQVVEDEARRDLLAKEGFSHIGTKVTRSTPGQGESSS